MTTRGTLYVLPNLIGDQRHHEPFIPSSVDKVVAALDGLISESESGGRRFLGRFKTEKPAHLIPLALYNEHTPDADLDFYLEPLMKGEKWGLISDAGLPCIADPGSKLVRRARQKGITVQVFSGPSAIVLALMHSGFSGQKFMFHGYLDKDSQAKTSQFKNLETISKKEGVTQIFMEAPYRNQQLLENLINELDDETWLCAAWDLTMPTQGVYSHPVKVWKKSPLPNIDKKNTVFLIQAS